MSGLTDEMRAEMTAINANLNHTRTEKSGARYFRFNDGEVVEKSDRAEAIVRRSMFPYYSVQMATEMGDIPRVKEEVWRKSKVAVEFDTEGRPQITSAKQLRAVAKAMGMYSGRDGFGHIDEHGNFQNSGRRRNDEVQEGRRKVRNIIKELESMPEEMPADAVRDALGEYDIFPTEENTG